MKYYDPDTLKKINDSVNLVDYIGKYIELEQRGHNYFGSCPLHIDETPSFSINIDDNYYYCFSCHRGGQIISFLIEYEGMSFADAVVKASKLANIDLEALEQPETITLLKAMKKNVIKKDNVVRTVLQQNVLEKYINEPAEEWIAEGISSETQKEFGVRIDQYSNRIIYPVYDDNNQLINIKGRIRLPNYKTLNLPKYISYYSSGTIDYFQGMEKARQEVALKKEIILFESIKSVMKCYEWGIKNTVAVESSMITDGQLKILIRTGATVVLAFDSDVDIYDKNHKKLHRTIKQLKQFCPVYVIEDKEGLLGGKEAKNSPADCGREVWEKLYKSRYRI